MNSTNSESDKSEKPDSKTINIEIINNNLIFTNNMTNLCKFILDKSNVNVNFETEKNNRVIICHTKLRDTCEKILNGLSTNDESYFDKSKIIKKIYKIIYENIDKLIGKEKVIEHNNFSENNNINIPNEQNNVVNYIPDISLFSIRNSDSKIVTLIPGLDISLIINYLSSDELDELWYYLYLIIISSIKMLTLINNFKKTGKVWDLINLLNTRVAIYVAKTKKEQYLFNPFIGIQSDNNFDLEKLFPNQIGVDNTADKFNNMAIKNLLGNLNIGNLLNVKDLNEQFKNITDNDISDASNSITNMLGLNKDAETVQNCNNLVKGIVDDLKTNGITDFVSTIENIKDKYADILDPLKFKNSGFNLDNFMKNATNEIENMKDENGNTIGKELMKKLEGPLAMFQNIQNMQKK
jgi:hypothetical protein